MISMRALFVIIFAIQTFISVALKPTPNVRCTSINEVKSFGWSHKILNNACVTALTYMPVCDAFAKDGEYGILEGRTAALIHPVVMLGLFALTAYSGILGLQWRQLRTSSDELKSTLAQLPTLSSGIKPSLPLSKAIESIQNEIKSIQSSSSNDESNNKKIMTLEKDLNLLRDSAVIEVTYNEISSKRKELLSKNPKEKHFNTGSILLGVGVSNAIYGALNSYFGAGELFPDSHLFFGATITGLWALAAALVPYMQKGNETARSLHIGLNSLNVILFLSQVYTGFDIVIEAWKVTSWP